MSSKKNLASRAQKLMTLRGSLLFDIGVRALKQFNEVIDKFLAAQFRSSNTGADKELKDATFLQLRDCQLSSQCFCVERVFTVLTNLGWFTRLAEDSNSSLRTVRPTVSTSTSPYNLAMQVQAENSGNDAEMNVDECEGSEQEPQRTDSLLELFIPQTFHDAVKWACCDRTLYGPFKSFMREYSEWTHKSENANLLRVKQKCDIKVTTLPTSFCVYADTHPNLIVTQTLTVT